MRGLFVCCLAACLTALSPVALYGQITITSAEVAPYFTPGTTHPIYGFSVTSLNVGSPSASAQTWNFASLVPADTSQRRILRPDQVPLGGDFPTATAVDFHYDDAPPGDTCTHYEFYRLEASGLTVVGEVKDGPCDGGPDTLRSWRHSPPQRFIALPATYGTTWSSTDSAVEGSRLRITTLTNVIDGFGTLVLWSGSYPALRWKQDEVTLTYQNGVFTQRQREVGIIWMTASGVLFQADAADTNQTSGTVPVNGAGAFVVNPATSVAAGETAIPSGIRLLGNYPNPFNPETEIRFEVAEGMKGTAAGGRGQGAGSHVRLSIFDLLGREVAVLVDAVRPAGTYSVRWNAEGFRSGTYFAVLRSGSEAVTRKIVLSK